MWWKNVEPIIQSEVVRENKYCILTQIYGMYKDGTDDPICRAVTETQT